MRTPNHAAVPGSQGYTWCLEGVMLRRELLQGPRECNGLG